MVPRNNRLFLKSRAYTAHTLTTDLTFRAGYFNSLVMTASCRKA